MWFVTLNLGFICIRFYSDFVKFHSDLMYFISSLNDHNNICKATSSFIIVSFMKNWVIWEIISLIKKYRNVYWFKDRKKMVV